ncbi:MAG: hypothetical protein Q4A55_06625 [Aerococcus sp.]|nr:hypothetical protein [Aerococcus sp.]
MSAKNDEGEYENPEFWYAYFALHRFHLLPSQFANLSPREKAILMAFIDEALKQEEKAQRKYK